MNSLHMECARVYISPKSAKLFIIKCCLCSMDAFTEWYAYLEHFKLRHSESQEDIDQHYNEFYEEDDDEIQAEVAVELANINKTESADESVCSETTFLGAHSVIYYDSDADSVDNAINGSENDEDDEICRMGIDIPNVMDKSTDNNKKFDVINNVKRPFYSLRCTNSHLMLHFIELLKEHECHWHANYKDAAFKTNRLNTAEKISQDLKQRWNVLLDPKCICVSGKALQHWFENQYAAHIGNVHFETRHPSYYTKLLEFLPTKHICVLVCDDCGQRCKSETRLRLHKYRDHNGPKPFFCNICKQSFLYESKFKMHQSRFHGKSFKWLCPQCGYTSPSKWDLQLHLNTHSNVRNFVCELCGNKYKTSAALAVHRRTHELPKLECTYCKKKFRENNRLKVHIEKFHEFAMVRNFSCNVCHKKFTSSEALEQHKLIHTNDELIYETNAFYTFEALLPE